MDKRVEQNLRRRAVVVKRQRMVLCLTGVIFLLSAVIFTSGKGGRVRAEDNAEKYFLQIQIEEGDTMWDIAGVYMTSQYESIGEYISEVEKINHISRDEITSGCYLIVPYYAETAVIE